MIDWFKATALVDTAVADSLQNRLDFKAEVNLRTGDLTEWPRQYQYDNLNFLLIPAKSKLGYWLEVSGSLHRFWERGTNYWQFSHKNVCTTIELLAQTCQIAPSAFEVRQLEFGVNMHSMPVDTQLLFDNLIAFKNKVFTPMRSVGGRSIGYDAETTDYKVKIYDKALQYNLPFEVCRFEVHLRQHIGRLVGVCTLAELTNREVMSRLGQHLTIIASQLVFDDVIACFDELRPSQRDFIERGRNTRYYVSFTAAERERFVKLIKQHGKDQFADILSRAVAKEWEILSTVC